MKTFFRFLGRNKLYTFIEVTGMAVAIAFVLFIGTFLINQFTADSQVKKQGNIYVGHFERLFICSGTVRGQLEGKFPEVQDMCRLMGTHYLSGIPFDMAYGDHTERQHALMADKNFFEFFPFPLLEGTHEAALQEKNSILLSQSCAARLFGDRSPLGEMIKISVGEDEHIMNVTGVFKDFTNTAFHAPDIIYRIDVLEDHLLMSNGNGCTALFFRLADGTDIGQLGEKIEAVLQENDFLYMTKLLVAFDLVPFGEINRVPYDVSSPFEEIIDPGFIRLFLGAGVLLLLFAVLNYVSLTVAQTGFRAREMASRRLLGAQKNAIVCRYILESFILTAISFGFGLLLAWACAPYFSELVGKQIDPLGNFGWLEGLFMAAVVLLLSVCSGVVPALIVSKFKPIDVVRGNFARTSKMTLSKILITCQSVIALVTLSVAAVMLLQIRHMVSKPMGYERDGRIMIAKANKPSDYYIEELKSLACVEKVGWLQFAPSTVSTAGVTLPRNGVDCHLSAFFGDQAAFDILGFEVLRQNAESLNMSMWLTESAMTALGVGYDCTQLEFDNAGFPVCGVIRDFYRGDANGTSGTRSDFISVLWVMEVESENDFRTLRELVVKVAGDENEAVAKIREFYRSKGFAEDEIQVESYNQLNHDLYYTENKNLKLITLFTFLTLLLSSLAMLAMSAYYARQHSKEAAVRKVMGCSRGRIYLETAAGFMKSVLVAVVIALPVAWLIAAKWLESYNYRIENRLWVYLLAAVVMLAVAVVSVSWQTIRLMNTNPVEALKSE